MEQNTSWSIMNVRLSHVMPMVVASASIMFASSAQATGTAAGTVINNTATATYNDAGGNPQSTPSNPVSLTVAEVLDVTAVWSDSGNVIVQPSATLRVLAFDVTNTGNGAEDFALTTNDTVGGDNFNPTVTNMYLDNLTSGTVGVYDPGVDVPYTQGTDFLPLAADASRRVFVVSTIPAGVNDADIGRVQMLAAARTGTGAPGTTYTGQGTGGADAIVGATSADADATGGYLVQNATISFVKSQSVVAPASVGGGAKTVPGSIITYQLVATVSGTGSLSNVAISDAIPANTTYEAGTMTLQAAALTDASDADAGSTTLTGPTVTGVSVNLGTVAGGQTRTVTFKVKVN